MSRYTKWLNFWTVFHSNNLIISAESNLDHIILSWLQQQTHNHFHSFHWTVCQIKKNANELNASTNSGCRVFHVGRITRLLEWYCVHADVACCVQGFKGAIKDQIINPGANQITHNLINYSVFAESSMHSLLILQGHTRAPHYDISNSLPSFLLLREIISV